MSYTCPKCGKGKLVLKRVEYRFKEVAYIFECEECGHVVEIVIERFIVPRRKPYILYSKMFSRGRWSNNDSTTQRFMSEMF